MQRLTNEHNNLKRLIKIARPVDLMPMHTETKRFDSTKKSNKLPLFGKRGTFKYSTVAPKSSKPIQQVHLPNNDEETEETDEMEPTGKEITKSEPIEKDVRLLDDKNITDKPSTSTRSSEQSKPVDVHQKLDIEQTSESQTTVTGNSEVNSQIPTPNGSSTNTSGNTTKKKRNRIRIRADKGRENVDFDEEMVDTDKYSTWVPPQGQSGDGSTDLNEKYGY